MAIQWEYFQKRNGVYKYVVLFGFLMLAEILRMTRTSGKVHDGSLNLDDQHDHRVSTTSALKASR